LIERNQPEQVKEQVMVHQFKSDYNPLVLQLPNAADGSSRNVEFIGGYFVTDDDLVAEQIKATRSFKSGQIKTVTGEIKQNKKKFKVVTGGRGTANSGDEENE
jgi:hypothetical protein